MEVSQKDDFITNVLITKNKTQMMRATNDSFLLHMLISSLYTDPILAMVRETITNGWDAHKEVGILDKPLEISVSLEGGLVIKDFGNGIPKTKFIDIYGVIGDSTKRQDINATGGFGLGCKSPLAYTSAFTVSSCCEGVKTVYAINFESSGAETAPAITEILSIPTSETGLTVEIPIKNQQDCKTILNNVYSVLYRGSILANVNGSLGVMIDLSTTDHPFIVLNKTPSFANLDKDVYILYGNIIYPVPEPTSKDSIYHNEYHDALLTIGDLDSTVILIAEPNTVSLVPSREAVSLSELTSATIKSLLSTFTKKLNFRKLQNILFQYENTVHNEIAKEISFLGRGFRFTYEHAYANKGEYYLSKYEEVKDKYNLSSIIHKYIFLYLHKNYSSHWQRRERVSLAHKKANKTKNNKLTGWVYKKKFLKTLFKNFPEYFKDKNNIKLFQSTPLLSSGVPASIRPQKYYSNDYNSVVILSHTSYVSSDISIALWYEFKKLFPGFPHIPSDETCLTLIRVPRTKGIVTSVSKTLSEMGIVILDATLHQELGKKKTPNLPSNAVIVHGGFVHRDFRRPIEYDYVKDDINKRFDSSHKCSIKDPVWYYSLGNNKFSKDKPIPIGEADNNIPIQAIEWAEKTYPGKGIILNSDQTGSPVKESHGATEVCDLYLDYVASCILKYKNALEYVFLKYNGDSLYHSALTRTILLPNNNTKIKEPNKKVKELIDSLYLINPLLFYYHNNRYQSKSIKELTSRLRSLSGDDFIEDKQLASKAIIFCNTFLSEYDIKKVNKIPGAAKHIREIFKLFLKDTTHE